MISKLIQALKNEMKVKDMVIWFTLSFISVLLVYSCVIKRSFDIFLLIEVLGFSFVFVLMMIGTRSYGHFVDGYYQSFIDCQNKKRKQAKCYKKR